MKLELKNIQVNTGMSEETHCYSASVWMDGKRVGEVGNHGHGGCDEQRIDQATLAKIDAWLTAHPPKGWNEDNAVHGYNIPYDLEMWCGDQINAHLVERDFSRILKTKVLFAHDGKLYEIPRKKHPLQAIVDHIKKKYGGNTQILNTMKRPEAVEIFNKMAA